MRASDDDGGYIPSRITPLPPPRPSTFENGGISGYGRGTPTPPINMGSIGNYFSDPVLQNHLDFGNSAISRLMQPQKINPVLQQAIGALTRMSSQGAPRMDTSWLSTFGNTVAQRQAELNKPGLSASQQDLMRTNVTDPLEAQRSAAKQQVMERMSARGIQPGSGIMEQALLDVDRQFSQMRTTGERELATHEIAQDESRKNQAVDIGGMLAQLGLSASSADMQGQIAGRGQNMQAAGALGGIGEGLQQEPIQRLMSAFGISNNLSQMPYQALGAAQGAAATGNAQRIPEMNDNGLIQLLITLAGQGENVYNDANEQGDSFWNVLGTSLPDILKTFSTLFPGGGAGSGSGAGPGPDGGWA